MSELSVNQDISDLVINFSHLPRSLQLEVLNKLAPTVYPESFAFPPSVLVDSEPLQVNSNE